MKYTTNATRPKPNEYSHIKSCKHKIKLLLYLSEGREGWSSFNKWLTLLLINQKWCSCRGSQFVPCRQFTVHHHYSKLCASVCLHLAGKFSC